MTKQKYVLVALLLLFVVLLLKTAWLCDDAYITFRTIDHFASGHGLVYNIGERVQAYTHPLWLFILFLLHAVTHEFYFTTIFLSIALTLVTLVLLVKFIPRYAALGIVILLVSKSFVEFSTSGLENPLSHLLLVIFLSCFYKLQDGGSKVRILAFLTAMATLSRPDALLMYLPPLALVVLRSGWRRQVPHLLVGLSPLIVWTAFSIFYYGAPFSNSAYAKLAAGIGRLALIKQSLFYYWESMTIDPITVVVIVAGSVVAVASQKARERAVASGVILYLLYLVWIGGDFMSGRFFALPLLAAVVMLLQWISLSGRKTLTSAVALVALFGLLSSKSNFVSGRDYGKPPEEKITSAIDEHGISDERFYYYQSTGLFRRQRGSTPDHPSVERGRRISSGVINVGAIGFVGFYAGPRVHVIDRNGLSDFMIARMAVPKSYGWRIGHFGRQLPTGYVASISSGENSIKDPKLAEYFDVVQMIVRGELLEKKRLAAIWRMNTGGYDDLIETSQ